MYALAVADACTLRYAAMPSEDTRRTDPISLWNSLGRCAVTNYCRWPVASWQQRNLQLVENFYRKILYGIRQATTMLYTSAAGYSTVVYTDVYQSLFIFTSFIIVAIMGFMMQLPDQFSVFLPILDSTGLGENVNDPDNSYEPIFSLAWL
ncbi:uncharacterized protein PHALS_00966 [Plasmopara halstedii]|uniref:Uncharacterized protein n=1 Tax=Plasmopara halstedii TaxID=4781 RepID=A0A0P1ASM1_PLAHL|nr:uncharacterized protein PHALS_00966 [Plasmopara halstedii]CEG44620.1 hypothetical protein PHALS_00966 [Plasmopara halstedii]|eukprot:XP_024580989.1 hypothetical protein PHALS_00966 [Plasmopara halstedii]